MRHAILIKECSHFLRNHVPIVGHRDERNFFARLWCDISDREGRFRLLCVGHNKSVYTKCRGRGLFKSFQGRTLGKLSVACAARHEIDCLSDRHRDAEVERYATMLTIWTRNFLEPVRNIRLCSQIKFHVGIYRKAVAAFEAHPTTFSVRLQSPSINAECIRLADRALYAGQALFYLFKLNKSHRYYPISQVVE